MTKTVSRRRECTWLLVKGRGPETKLWSLAGPLVRARGLVGYTLKLKVSHYQFTASPELHRYADQQVTCTFAYISLVLGGNLYRLAPLT